MTVSFPSLSQAGRLGNQHFQVAATLGLAAARGETARFPAWDYEPFFNVPAELFGPISGTPATDLVPHLDERAKVYLQDFSLFAAIEDQIREYFEPSALALKVLDEEWEKHFAELDQPIVSVHVRRGDNVTHPRGYHPLRSMEYYRHALEEMPVGSVVVFSDDPAWCREHFEEATGREVAVFYEGTARPREYVDRVLYENAPILDWIDLQLMAAMDLHILSNSTYAWWGAFLSGDHSPVYPAQWFGPLVSGYTDSRRMFPTSWREMFDATEGLI